MEYYIKDTENADGPYDLMAIIRKVRNGSVSENTPIATTLFEEPKPAISYEEFADFFLDDENDNSAHSITRSPRNLQTLLMTGVEFLKNNLVVAIYSGIFMIAWVLIAMTLMSKGSIFLSLLGVGLCYFLMGGYLFGILRFIRGNPVTVGLILKQIFGTAMNMGVVSMVVAVLMLPPMVMVYLLGEAMLVITLPVLFIALLSILTLFSFTPLLVTYKGLDFWDAMRESLRVVMMNKGQNLGNVFGLMALNFIFCFAIPVIFPVTMSALVDLYDEYLG